MSFKNLFNGKHTEANVKSEARRQHYLFAHRLMSQLAHAYGARTALLLNNEEIGPKFLLEVWNDAGEGVPASEQVAPKGLAAHVFSAEGKLVAVVTLPKPVAAPEAFFTAIVCDIPPESPQDESEESFQQYGQELEQMPVEYFTLEYGHELDGTFRTVFCGWTKEGSHFNMGDGPPPSEDAFVEHILSKRS